MQARGQVLITAAELAGMIQAGDPVSILDVRWRLDEPDGHAAYLQGHLPGAVFVSLEDELSDHTIAGRGRHPLPSGASLQATVRRCGIRHDVPVVVYDDWNRAGSARAWWVLTAAGIANVRILDGGLPAWRSAGGSIETGQVSPQLGNVTVLHDDLYAGQRLTLTAQQAGAGGVTLLDARVPERFRGDVEPVDAVTSPAPSTFPAVVSWPTTARSLAMAPLTHCCPTTASITVAAWVSTAARVSAQLSSSRHWQ